MPTNVLSALNAFYNPSRVSPQAPSLTPALARQLPAPSPKPFTHPTAAQWQTSHPSLLFSARRKKAVDSAQEPLLATEVALKKVKYPVYISPKVDGNRGMVQNGTVLGRGLVPIPNPFVQSILGRPELEGFDGELICGEPNTPEVLNKTNRLMSPHAYTEGDLRFMVFDLMNHPNTPLEERLALLKEKYAKLPRKLKRYVKLMPQKLARKESDILKQEKTWLAQGYEGAILRNPQAPYLNRRASMTNQALMKLKRFQDAEALVVDFYPLTPGASAAKSILKKGQLTAEEMKNLPESKQGAAGYMVEDLKTHVRFKLHTPPMTLEERQALWKNRKAFVGRIVKYKYFPYGMDPVTQIPRHATLIGFREDFDLPKELLTIARKFKTVKPNPEERVA